MRSAPEPAHALTRRQLNRLLLSRVAVFTLLLGGTILYHLRLEGWTHPVLPFFYGLTVVTYLQAFVSAVFLPRAVRLRLFAQAQITWDLLLVTALVYITGGIGSIFSFLYLLVIVSGSVFLGRKEVFIVASAAAILYGSLLDLQFYGYLPQIEALTFPEEIDGGRVFHAVFVHVLAFFLTAFLSGTAAERLRRSESALEKRTIDYEELENLNRTILAHINSGLLMINPQGRIRSFNRAAEKLTGYSLEDVYDRDIRTLFAKMEVLGEQGFIVESRGEATVVHKGGQPLIFGYASTPIDDPHGAPLGLLVTFQDLTPYKKMEEELKRTDRLAAVGRLAAGIAHEIRNPLAAISGSAHLLMEGNDLREGDRRLMGIVVREADRLSRLLTDFLLYARPTPPDPSVVDVSKLLDELADVIASDRRFENVIIRRDYPGGVKMLVDRQQISQVLWDLAINGAEAMEGEGELRFAVRPDESLLFIEDTGPGIPPEVRERIFEPFFTTKDAGTGLGLSTVYTLVQGHDGRIDVAEGKTGGTRFVIRLPGRVVQT